MSNFTELVKDTLDYLRLSYKKDSSIFVSDAFYEYFCKTAVAHKPAGSEKKGQQRIAIATQRPTASKTEAKTIKGDEPFRAAKAATQAVVREKNEEDKITPGAKEKQHYIFSEEMKRKIQKTLPSVKVLCEVPDASAAKRLAGQENETTATRAVILYFEETGPSISFLENVRKAIDERLIPCSLACFAIHDDAKGADTFFLKYPKEFVIASKSIYECKALSPYIKKDQNTSQYTLGSNPLFILDSLETYSNEPSKKRELWNTLCLKLRP